MRKALKSALLVSGLFQFAFLSAAANVPAEFAPSEGVIVAPMSSSYKQHRNYFASLIKEIKDAGAKPFIIAADSTEKSSIIKDLLPIENISESSVEFLSYENDEIWARDYAPLFFYKDGKRAIVDNEYYFDLRDNNIKRPLDNKIPDLIGAGWKETVIDSGIYTEGGNFMTDGEGTCMMTTAVFDKNPGKFDFDITPFFEENLGCEKVYYIDPLPGEATRHIDMFSKIIDRNTILVAEPAAISYMNDAQKAFFKTIYDTFANLEKADGTKFEVVKVTSIVSGDKIFSHTNSLIVNKTVIVPTYVWGTDDDAIKVYEDNMPGYKVVGIATQNILVEGGGAIHCTTMQVPLKTAALNTCGNKELDAGEICDGNEIECDSINDKNYISGKAPCSADCLGFIESSCVEAAQTDEDTATIPDSDTPQPDIEIADESNDFDDILADSDIQNEKPDNPANDAEILSDSDIPSKTDEENTTGNDDESQSDEENSDTNNIKSKKSDKSGCSLILI